MYFEAIKWVLGMTEGSTASHPRPAAGDGTLRCCSMNLPTCDFPIRCSGWQDCFGHHCREFRAAQTATHKPQRQPEASQAQSDRRANSTLPELVAEGKCPLPAGLLLLSWPRRYRRRERPDLTRSKLVSCRCERRQDRRRRAQWTAEKGMPPFDRSDDRSPACRPLFTRSGTMR